ncbi:MAG TPA: hypothetical protein VK421_17920 [Pyrinomonadaceae bacterium]|nr:hypothetical protein [Pyrinomonadaceae bacterium]
MALGQFLLPGEDVRYESSGSVRHGLTPYRLYLTGERLLLHSEGGPLGRKESVVAENLADVESLEYTEGGILSGRASLKVNFGHETISLSGEPDVLKEVWRNLQPYAVRGPVSVYDEEATLVAPLEPLFDDQPYPPARVEPIPAAGSPAPRRSATARRLPLVLGAVCLLVIAAAGVVTLRRGWPPAPETPAQRQPAEIPPPLVPTPVAMRIMDEVFTLEPGAHRAVKFTVPAEPAGARLSGGFRVTAGSYVDFYLMSEAQYDRFAAGGPPDVTSAVYRRDQWNARVGERLPAGNYYLVFDNREGEGGAQTVAGEFTVTYDQNQTT